MNKKLLFLPLLLIAVAVSGEQIVRVISTSGLDKAFATDQVRKLVLTSTAVDVVNIEGSVLLSVPSAEIARVEFTEGEPDPKPDPDPTTAVGATIVNDNGVTKIIEGGQVYIINSGRKYTIMGVEVVNSKE